ncbi:MAG: transcriptional repressor [Alphaproteobacteria bacterium]|nr:transcriptional repressor [Alphaproteobacteria bacterium]
MGEHRHLELSGSGLLAAARDSFVEAGEQWTEMRANVLEALAACERPISAYDLAESVSALRGKRVAPNSVYRILDLFVRTNLARRVESANAYLVNSHPGCRHDCIFLICDSCGEAKHIDDDRLTGSLVEAARATGFADIRPVVELRGICARCG